MTRTILGIGIAMALTLSSWCVSPAHAQASRPPNADTALSGDYHDDPFGPENAPDFLGSGAGGVLTPSPHDNITQTYFTRANPDYFGVQYMRDSPFQVAAGVDWSAYQSRSGGALLKARGFIIRETAYDDVRKDEVPRYFLSYDGSLERPWEENDIRAYRVRIHGVTSTEGLGMAGVGVLSSKWNLLVGADRSMDRKLEIEASWLQMGGGYIMPLSSRTLGVNLAICMATELAGLRYQKYYSDQGTFFGAKVASIGWMLGVGVNANQALNITGCVGGEWGFSLGNLRLPTGIDVLAEIGRSTLFVSGQATAGWFNLTGGIQLEWEYLDYPQTGVSHKAIRYYLGTSLYIP